MHVLSLPANYRLADLSALKAKKRERVLYALHKVAAKMDQYARRGHVNIHSDDWTDWIGNDYKKYLKILFKAGVLRIQKSKKRNDYKLARYSAGGFCEATGKYYKSFAIGYRLTTSERIVYQTKVLKIKVIIPEDETDLDNPVAVRQSEVVKSIKIDEAEFTGTPLYHEVRQFNVYCAVGSIKLFPNAGRLSNSFIREKKTIRTLAKMDGKEIFEFDLKCSFGYFLYHLIDDPSERALFSELYNGDFYAISPKEREVAKLQYMKFLFQDCHGMRTNKKSGKRYAVNPFAKHHGKYLPNLFKRILSFCGSELSICLSTLESSIFNDFLIPKSTKLGFKCISCYDGYAVNNLDSGEILARLCADEMEKLFGLRPEIKNKRHSDSKALIWEASQEL